MHYIYILRCADDSYYVGSAQDLDSRVKAHNESAAVTPERQLKHWTHGKKQALVEGHPERLKHLSKPHL